MEEEKQVIESLEIEIKRIIEELERMINKAPEMEPSEIIKYLEQRGFEYFCSQAIPKLKQIFNVENEEELEHWLWYWDTWQGGSMGVLGAYCYKGYIVIVEGTWYKHSNYYKLQPQIIPL